VCIGTRDIKDFLEAGACGGVAMAFTRHGLLHLMSWIAFLSLAGSTSGEVTPQTSSTIRSVLRQLQSYEIIHLRPTKGFSTASIADGNGMHECDGCCLWDVFRPARGRIACMVRTLMRPTNVTCFLKLFFTHLPNALNEFYLFPASVFTCMFSVKCSPCT
jgi:hypothetical protein